MYEFKFKLNLIRHPQNLHNQSAYMYNWPAVDAITFPPPRSRRPTRGEEELTYSFIAIPHRISSLNTAIFTSCASERHEELDRTRKEGGAGH